MEVLRQFGMAPPDALLVVAARDVLAPYSGMLPGFVSGHYDYREAHIDIRPLARNAGALVVHAEVTALDLDNRLAHFDDRPPIPFDYLSINVGSSPADADVPGAAEYAIPAKPVDAFIVAWRRMQREAARATSPYRIVVAGAGAGGVELCLTMRHAAPQAEFHLIAKGDAVMENHAPAVQRRLERALERKGVRVHRNTVVTRVDEGAAHIDTGAALPYDALIWVTHAAPAPWLAASSLATDERGFVLVNECLQSTSHPFVFAAGDCATIESSPRPKSGVFAVRQGPYLARNLDHAVAGRPLEAFQPQRQFLGLIGTGDENAVASRGPFAAEGKWVWRWKDHIDRTFMRRYALENTVPGYAVKDMQSGTNAMPCGGCGAKAGPDLLRGVLAGLGVDNAIPFEDAASISLSTNAMIQSVDLFRMLLDDPYRSGRIAAVHGLNDLYACGASPKTALATVVLPFAPEDFQAGLLRDILAGIRYELDAAGCRLAGGHTAESRETLIGLALTGEPGATTWSKSGAQPGDLLVLTKPLGTGVLFAADMTQRVEGPTLDAALHTMSTSNKAAADIFARFRVHACTDVSGFGLVGHALEMTEGDGHAIRILLRTAHVPLLPQTENLFAQGFASSLHNRNRRFAERHGFPPTQSVGKIEALVDPQTAGGLLAALPAERAMECLDALKDAGYADAAVVGVVESQEGKPVIDVV